MSELQSIELALSRAARRRRQDRTLNGFGRGLFFGGIVVLLTLATYKLLPVPQTVIIGALAVGGATVLAGIVWGAWRKMSLLETARWVDERKALKERLSTALEISGARAPEDWKRLLLADAAQHAQALNTKELLPLGFPRMARWALLVVALCAGLGFVPEYRSKAHIQKQQDAANIKDVGKNLS